MLIQEFTQHLVFRLYMVHKPILDRAQNKKIAPSIEQALKARSVQEQAFVHPIVRFFPRISVLGVPDFGLKIPIKTLVTDCPVLSACIAGWHSPGNVSPFSSIARHRGSIEVTPLIWSSDRPKILSAAGLHCVIRPSKSCTTMPSGSVSSIGWLCGYSLFHTSPSRVGMIRPYVSLLGSV